jgi:hypothetical protein
MPLEQTACSSSRWRNSATTMGAMAEIYLRGLYGKPAQHVDKPSADSVFTTTMRAAILD